MDDFSRYLAPTMTDTCEWLRRWLDAHPIALVPGAGYVTQRPDPPSASLDRRRWQAPRLAEPLKLIPDADGDLSAWQPRTLTRARSR